MFKKLSISPTIIGHLGSDLITSSAVAFVELIKNSIDALVDEKDKKINVGYYEALSEYEGVALMDIPDDLVFNIHEYVQSSNFFVVEDLGCGMNNNTIEKGFLKIGTEMKKKSKTSNKIILGEKGIGRLAAQRLGDVLVVESASKDEKYANVIIIAWNELKNDDSFEEIQIPYFKCDKVKNSYTRLWIFGANDEDIVQYPGDNELIPNASKIKMNEQLDNAVSFLISPFSKTVNKPELNFYFRGLNLIYGLDPELLKYSETVHSFKLYYDQRSNGLRLEFKLKINPWYLLRVHNAKIKPKSEFVKYKKNIDFYSQLLKKYKDRFETSFNYTIDEEEIIELIYGIKRDDLDIKKKDLDSQIETLLLNQAKREIDNLYAILPINGSIYSFKKDIKFFKYAMNFFDENKLSIKDMQILLDKYNGVKLYRQGYRIGFLGNKDNDWLKFQQYRTQGQQFYRFNLATTVGEIEINDATQKFVKEVSSRLDIKRNETASSLLLILEKICNTYFFKFNVSLNEMVTNILDDEGLLQGNIKKKIKVEIDTNRELIKENRRLQKKLEETRNLLTNLPQNANGIREISDKAYRLTLETVDLVSLQINSNDKYFKSSKSSLDEASAGIRNIEIEAFNNYKLMANGLITETITHELHSLITNNNNLNMDNSFDILKYFIIDADVKLYNNHLKPIRDSYINITESINDVSNLYNFLESTFINNNSKDEYETVKVSKIINDVEVRLKENLNRNKVEILQNEVDQFWCIPKGVLLHILYNLFNNSIYWIDKRLKYSKNNKFYLSESKNSITIEGIGVNSILIYDSGTGVKKEMEFVLFDPLQSGKGADGRGMGLYIVKKLLNSFGGDIELLPDRNEYDNRYKFLLTVPEDSYRGVEND